MNKKCLIDILGITMAILCAIITGIFGRAWNGGYIFYMFSFLVSGSLIYFLIKDFSLKREKTQDTFFSRRSILGKKTVVIGKKNSEEDIDIDLCDTAFGGTVSDIHAVLNYVEGLWYIEDMQSKNGTQIKGFLQVYFVRLLYYKVYPLKNL